MISNIELLIPLLVIIRSIYNLVFSYHIIADRGDLHYSFKSKKSKISETSWSILFTIGLPLILLIFFSDYLDMNFMSHFRLYFNHPLEMFDESLYNELFQSFRNGSDIEYQTFKRFETTIKLLPQVFVFTFGAFTESIPKLLRQGIYGNGIFYFSSFYEWDKISSYSFNLTESKLELILKLHKKGFFSKEAKTAELKIQEDEQAEIESYLKHEIRNPSPLECELTKLDKG